MYTDEQLRHLLETLRDPRGVLSRGQLEALLAWEETPEHEREAISARLDQLPPPEQPAELTERERDLARERGLIDAEGEHGEAQRSPFRRLVDRLRGR